MRKIVYLSMDRSNFSIHDLLFGVEIFSDFVFKFSHKTPGLTQLILFTTTETGIKGILDSKKSMFLNFLFMKVEFSEGLKED